MMFLIRWLDLGREFGGCDRGLLDRVVLSFAGAGRRRVNAGWCVLLLLCGICKNPMQARGFGQQFELED